MMHIGPTDAKLLTLAEYQGLLHRWHEAHSTEEEALEPPDHEFAAKRREALKAKGVKVLH